jgi:alpha-tubulin suppressor-like RCC1 family protein
MRCWGSNRFGQLGVGSHGAPRATPAAIAPGLAPISASAVAAGAEHACLIDRNNVWCWGRNTFGQLGNGSRGHAARPTLVNLFGATAPASICAGEGHTCAVMGDGTVRCWGHGNLGQIGNGMTASAEVPVALLGIRAAVKVTCGQNHTCALHDDGSVTCWGSNDHGQTGLPLSPSARLSPAVVAGVTATDIAAGASSTCATNSAGAVTCWGRDDVGQLGGGVAGAARATPGLVTLAASASGVLGGFGHHCAWGAGLNCWGSNGSAQLGIGAASAAPAGPMAVPSIVSPLAVTGGFAHTCALTGVGARSGRVSCWGDNRLAQVGAAPGAIPIASPTAVMLAGDVEATAIAAGGGAASGADQPTGMTCAVTVAGGVQCWGSNVWGELGDGAAFAAQPVDVAFPPL